MAESLSWRRQSENRCETNLGRWLVVRIKQMTPVASSSASPASEHVLDQRGASFETAAPQLPQDEGFS